MQNPSGKPSGIFRRLRASVPLAVLIGAALAATPPEVDAQDRYAIESARLVPVSGPVIERGTVLVDDGVIAALGESVDIPAGTRRIDGEGMTVYPGFVNALTSLGLPATAASGGGGRQGGAGGLSDSYSWGPEDRPATFTWVNAADEFEIAADAFASWRESGFTTAVTVPENGFFTGHAALVNLGEGRSNDRVVRTPLALRVNLSGGPGHQGYPTSLMGSFAYLKQLFYDAAHYADAWTRYEANPRALERPPYDRTLAPLGPVLSGEEPILFPANDRTQALRALATAQEMGARPILYGMQRGYDVTDVLAEAGVPVLVDVDWPSAPRDADPENEPTLDQLRFRLRAPTTPAALAAEAIPFAFYSEGDPGTMLENVRAAVDAGLSSADAIRALTLTPAEIFGADDRVGSLEVGKAANLVVTDGDLFEDGSVRYVFVDGQRSEFEAGTAPQRRAEASEGPSETELRELIGPDHRGPYRDDPVTVIRNATILTVTGGTIEGGSIVIRDGKIVEVGTEVSIPDGAHIVDATGQFVMPGIIDAHTHIAGGGNEGSVSVSAGVGIEDVINPDDANIYGALTGGVTTVNVLHGSANAIGGKNAVLKLRWGSDADELRVEDAPKGIKFALGENPTRNPNRYPDTRMGVVDVIREAFVEANEYRDDWAEYEAAIAAGESMIPPRRDLKLEALAEILNGERLVHAHSYRADEILQLLRVAEEFDFTISTFQHVLEGYKVAQEMAEHGAGASTFSDWWAYKMEAFDAIPYNAAIMVEQGVNVSINSDDSEEMRHLNEEAAKTIKWGGLSETEALSLITINPARQLGIDETVGSIEVGKDADLAIFDRHPLDNYSVVQQTYVDGKLYFDVEADRERQRQIEAEKEALKGERPRGPITTEAVSNLEVNR